MTRPMHKAGHDGYTVPSAILRDAPLARGPQNDDETGRPLYNHLFHLKNTYGNTAAISIMISAIG
jgi:hypothetical protein